MITEMLYGIRFKCSNINLKNCVFQYESLERAIAWLENHENDPDIDDPVGESCGNVLGSSATPGQTAR